MDNQYYIHSYQDRFLVTIKLSISVISVLQTNFLPSYLYQSNPNKEGNINRFSNLFKANENAERKRRTTRGETIKISTMICTIYRTYHTQ